MKIDNGQYKFEKRRKRTFTPIIYMLAEIVFAWILLSIVNISFEVQTWGIGSYIILFLAFSYSVYKTQGVYERQKDYEVA